MNAKAAPSHTPKRRTPQPPPLRKPLYLNGTHLRSLTLEGPALKVEDDLGRNRFYPLARISRIILRGHMACTTDVLEHILASGLSMTILDQDEHLIGWLVSAQPLVLSMLQQRLEDAKHLGLLDQTLENWRLSRLRMMLLHHVVPHLSGVHPADLRTRTMRNRASGLLYRRTGQDWRRIMRRFRGSLRAMAIQQLQDVGVDARWLGADETRPDLAGILAGLLEWVLWGAALKRKRPTPLQTWRESIAFFEASRNTLERSAKTLIDDLNHTLREALFYLGERP